MNILNENDLLSKLKGKDVVDLIRFSLNNEYIYRFSFFIKCLFRFFYSFN